MSSLLITLSVAFTDDMEYTSKQTTNTIHKNKHTQPIEDWKRVMNASKHEKLPNFKEKKWMPLKLFEFLERSVIGAFLVTLNQLEKTGSIGKVFIPLEI